jgi:hypothetical protein
MVLASQLVLNIALERPARNFKLIPSFPLPIVLRLRASVIVSRLWRKCFSNSTARYGVLFSNTLMLLAELLLSTKLGNVPLSNSPMDNQSGVAVRLK